MLKNLTIKSYWHNEAKIQKLVAKVGATIEQIVNSPDSFSEDVILSLKNLLERKELLLLKLANLERQALVGSPVVDLASYRELSLIAGKSGD